jgi:hypothetical protein
MQRNKYNTWYARVRTGQAGRETQNKGNRKKRCEGRQVNPTQRIT